MSSQSLELGSKLVEYLPERLESSQQVDEAFRDAVKDWHPDQTDGGTQEQFVAIKEDRSFLKDCMDSSRSTVYRVESKRTPRDIDMEAALERGMNSLGDERESYDVKFAQMGDVCSAMLDDPGTNMKTGLEVKRTEKYTLEATATYFTDRFGELEEINGSLDLRGSLEGDEHGQSAYVDAIEEGIGQIGRWALTQGEETIKPKYN
ncbi:hypothetical protein [Candidatus Nanohalococcus occultus]|uniref:hypothetical protein n=1 Tax=Candidatus Nanohalococcus occultus TaxID=2978047 RepID=UPI0039E1E19C